MNSLFDLSNLYRLACNIWPRFPYDIPQLQTALKPFLYLFNITNQCNLNCYYCCQKTSLTRNRPELSFEDISGIIKKLPRYSVIVFSGGEPLCRDDFTKLLKETRRLKRKTALLTNGLLLNDDIICEMIQNRLLNIGIAIDGDKYYYEKIKGRGNYAVVMENVGRLAYHKKKAKSSFPAFDWKVTVFPENVSRLPLLYQQAADHGADSFTVSFPKKNEFQFNDCLHDIAVLDCEPVSNGNYRFPENIEDIYKELFSIARTSRTRLRTYPQMKQAEDLKNYFETSAIQKRYSACRMPWSGMVISSTGEAYPCLSVRIGDLKKQSLAQVLTSPENIRFRNQLKKRSLFAICDGCCYARLKPVLKRERAVGA